MNMLFNKITAGLLKFRLNGGINHNEGNLLANLNEELTEVLRASTAEEIVGELSDVFILALNGLCQNGLCYHRASMFHPQYNYQVPTEKESMFIDIGTQLLRMVALKTGKKAALNTICEDVMYWISKLGYNPHLVILETIKKINSREVVIDKDINKLVKITTPEAMAKWYTPDYKSCRV